MTLEIGFRPGGYETFQTTSTAVFAAGNFFCPSFIGNGSCSTSALYRNSILALFGKGICRTNIFRAVAVCLGENALLGKATCFVFRCGTFDGDIWQGLSRHGHGGHTRFCAGRVSSRRTSRYADDVFAANVLSDYGTGGKSTDGSSHVGKSSTSTPVRSRAGTAFVTLCGRRKSSKGQGHATLTVAGNGNTSRRHIRAFCRKKSFVRLENFYALFMSNSANCSGHGNAFPSAFNGRK